MRRMKIYTWISVLYTTTRIKVSDEFVNQKEFYKSLHMNSLRGKKWGATAAVIIYIELVTTFLHHFSSLYNWRKKSKKGLISTSTYNKLQVYLFK